VQVHHITPPEESGSDEIDNAAPLCAGCHDKYGHDPTKRKQIREMRDQWYGICETMYKDPQIKIIVVNTANIYDSKKRLEQKKGEDMSVNLEIQKSLSEIYSAALNRFRTSKNYDDIAVTSGYVATASTAVNAPPSEKLCGSCGRTVSITTRFCSYCGSPIS
jgi:hypothetical protein